MRDDENTPQVENKHAADPSRHEAPRGIHAEDEDDANKSDEKDMLGKPPRRNGLCDAASAVADEEVATAAEATWGWFTVNQHAARGVTPWKRNMRGESRKRKEREGLEGRKNRMVRGRRDSCCFLELSLQWMGEQKQQQHTLMNYEITTMTHIPCRSVTLTSHRTFTARPPPLMLLSDTCTPPPCTAETSKKTGCPASRVLVQRR